MWSPKPIEVKIFSNDSGLLKKKAPEIEEKNQQVRGVVDTFSGLVYTGLCHQPPDALPRRPAVRLTAEDMAVAVNTAMLGRTASSVLEGDRVVEIRVKVDPSSINRLASLRDLPLRAADGTIVRLSQVVDVVEEPGQLELRREDMRQDVAVTARLGRPGPRKRHGRDPRRY